MRRTVSIMVALAVAAPAGVRADEEDLDDVADDKGEKADQGKGDDQTAAAPPPVTLGGRVFARAEASETDLVPWTGELSLASARLGASYRWKDRLRVKVALEAAGGASVRDAFVETWPGGGVAVRAGRFKGLASVIERESAWTLPTIGRGAIAEVLEDGITLSGRRDGLQVAWAPAGGEVRMLAVLSQSMSTTGEAPARPLSDGGGVAAALRGEVALCPGLRLGVVGSNREVNYVNDVRRYWAGAVDAEVDLRDAGLGLRLWADVVVGESHLGATTAGDPVTGFVAGQLIAGWRFGGAKKGKPYVEPYLLGAYLNPSWQVRRDDVTDAVVGVAAGRWKRWRGQAQLSVVNARARRPGGLAGVGVDLDDRVTASLQLGAAF